MKKEDFVIQSEVRRMLIRSNIDYSKIDYGTVKGVVYFRGLFRLPVALEGHDEAKRTMTIKALLSFEKKIRSIPGVVDVVFQFRNWLKERGQWIPIKSMKTGEKKIDEREREPESKKEEDDQPEEKTETRLTVSANIKGA